jgi:hypothetical protein
VSGRAWQASASVEVSTSKTESRSTKARAIAAQTPAATAAVQTCCRRRGAAAEAREGGLRCIGSRPAAQEPGFTKARNTLWAKVAPFRVVAPHAASRRRPLAAHRTRRATAPVSRDSLRAPAACRSRRRGAPPREHRRRTVLRRPFAGLLARSVDALATSSPTTTRSGSTASSRARSPEGPERRWALHDGGASATCTTRGTSHPPGSLGRRKGTLTPRSGPSQTLRRSPSGRGPTPRAPRRTPQSSVIGFERTAQERLAQARF